MICASIVVEANTGITWLSQGSWRDGWWGSEDAILNTYRQYVETDATTLELKQALVDFKKGWNAIAATDEERYEALMTLYVTDQKDALEFVEGEAAYHIYHKKYHNTYRELMVSRNYYDIFFFDTKGNLIF